MKQSQMKSKPFFYKVIYIYSHVKLEGFSCLKFIVLFLGECHDEFTCNKYKTFIHYKLVFDVILSVFFDTV